MGIRESFENLCEVLKDRKEEVDTLLNNKVDKISGKGLSTNDYTTAEKDKLEGIDIGANKTIVDSSVNSTSTNPVQNKAVMSFVNSSISTNTATFRGTFNSVAELNNYSGTKTNNDYAFVVSKDSAGNTVYNRYKYNDSTWEYEYALNNSSFTAEQWGTINSGLTASDKTSISEKYTKPSSGIPKSDLDANIISSLNKADSAIQDISGKADKSEIVDMVLSEPAIDFGNITEPEYMEVQNEISDLKEDLSTLKNLVISDESSLVLDLSKSQINSSTGVETPVTTTTTTTWTVDGYINKNILKSVIVASGYRVGVYGYDRNKENFVFIGYKTAGEINIGEITTDLVRFDVHKSNWHALTKEEAETGLDITIVDTITNIGVPTISEPNRIEIGYTYDPTTGIGQTFNALYKNYVYDVSSEEKVFVEREIPKYSYFYFFVNEYGDLSTVYKNNGTSKRATCSEWVNTRGYRYMILPCNTGFGSYVEDSIVVKVNKKYTLQEVSEQVFENKNAIVDNKDFETRYEMFLPEKIYEVRGHEMNIYWKNLVRNFDEIVLATTSLYQTFSNYKQITLDFPVGDEHSIQYDYYANNGNMDKLGHFEIPVKCVEESAKTGNIKAMFIGDSLIGYGIITDTILQTFNADAYSNIELVGTRNEVNSEYTPVYPSQNKHEGRGGWTTNNYRKTAVKSSIINPFYNSEVDDFDFAYYMSHQSVSIPDYIFIYLGTNDVWHNINALTTAENIKHMIESIHAYNPSIKVCVSYIKTGYKGQYKSGTNYPTDLVIKRNFDINNELQKQFSNKTNENVYTVPVCFNIDEENGYKLGKRTENARDTDEVTYCIDGTHPKVSAFQQMADSFYAFIKCN